MEKRYLTDAILSDALASHKLAFISGPRQVGKTTLSKQLLKDLEAEGHYYSFDDEEFKKLWAKSPKSLLMEKPACIVLDEIHKDRLWKNKLKGLYDLYGNKTKIIVTGSARLDFFRKSGDSLQGRYFPYRLHPFTYGESENLKIPPEHDWLESESKKENFSLNDLENLSGFPEPLMNGSEAKFNRWKKLYHERLIREDVRDLQNIRDINQLNTLSLLLREKASGQLSYATLREDINCSFDTVLKWIEILEAVYYCYRIRPYSKNVKNSLKKEPKLYFHNWSLTGEGGARFENMIAGHLLKNAQAWTDCALGEFELYYLRDKQKREVDFLLTKDAKPYLLLEVKSNQSEPTKSLDYFNRMLKPKFCIQLVRDKIKERKKLMSHPKIQILEAKRFLSALN